jgi:hypothetical protein
MRVSLRAEANRENVQKILGHSSLGQTLHDART